MHFTLPPQVPIWGLVPSSDPFHVQWRARLRTALRSLSVVECAPALGPASQLPPERALCL